MTVPYYKADGRTVVALGPNGVLTATATHPHYDEIVAGLESGDDSVLDLFDVGAGVARKFRKVTERVSWDGVNVLWDGDPVHSVLADQIKRALEAGETNYEALARFWEKLESNPEKHSREMAYEWLANHAFVITEDGDVVAYKGLSKTGMSTRAGHAFVDGVEYTNAYIPNEDGTEVSMPRSEVAHDPAAACHTGLHIGAWSFASRFGGGVTKMITFNPRDLCSVPDHATKARVSRYKVIRTVTEPVVSGPILKDETVSTWAGSVGYAR